MIQPAIMRENVEEEAWEHTFRKLCIMPCRVYVEIETQRILMVSLGDLYWRVNVLRARTRSDKRPPEGLSVSGNIARALFAHYIDSRSLSRFLPFPSWMRLKAAPMRFPFARRVIARDMSAARARIGRTPPCNLHVSKHSARVIRFLGADCNGDGDGARRKAQE